MNALASVAVEPRKRSSGRKRGSTNGRQQHNPEALASGNGHLAEAKEAVKANPARAIKPRRQYHRITLGGVVPVEQGEFIPMFDGDALLTGMWRVESREESDNRVTVQFPVDKFPQLPDRVWLDRDGNVQYRIFPKPAKGTTPNPPLEWIKVVPADHPRREAFVAKRNEWRAGLSVAERVEPRPKPAPVPVQWFQIVLPQITMKDDHWNEDRRIDGDLPPDARSQFPQHWPCKIVQPQPVSPNWRWVFGQTLTDPNWTYVQLPCHYFYFDGREEHRRTDGGGAGKVKFGMWVPNSLLRPVTEESARELHVGIVAERFNIYPDDARRLLAYADEQETSVERAASTLIVPDVGLTANRYGLTEEQAQILIDYARQKKLTVEQVVADARSKSAGSDDD